MCSPCVQCRGTWSPTWSKLKSSFIRPGRLPLLHGPFLMLTWLVHNWSAAIQSSPEHLVMHCLFRNLSVRNSINLFYSLLWCSSSGCPFAPFLCRAGKSNNVFSLYLLGVIKFFCVNLWRKLYFGSCFVLIHTKCSSNTNRPVVLTIVQFVLLCQQKVTDMYSVGVRVSYSWLFWHQILYWVHLSFWQLMKTLVLISYSPHWYTLCRFRISVSVRMCVCVGRGLVCGRETRELTS